MDKPIYLGNWFDIFFIPTIIRHITNTHNKMSTFIPNQPVPVEVADAQAWQNYTVKIFLNRKCKNKWKCRLFTENRILSEIYYALETINVRLFVDIETANERVVDELRW